MSNHRKLAAALLCSAGIALTATSASAMPANPALKNAAPGAVETVRWVGGWRGGWRGGGWGWGLGGFAAGAIIGSAIAAPYYYGYGGYYPYGYYGAYPAYDYPPPAPYGGPAYGGPAHRPGGGRDAPRAPRHTA